MTSTYCVLWLVTVLAVLGGPSMMQPAYACSCMPEHPQSVFCNAEYVIVAQVLRKTRSEHRDNDAYKIVIKKEYKMSPEARIALRNGKIYTSSASSTCGISLTVNELYLIAAKGNHVGECNFVRPYSELSVVEKRGMAGLYRKGCKCEIKPCFSEKCNPAIGACNWVPWSRCESNFGACIPAGQALIDGRPSKCHWRRSPLYRQCTAEKGRKHEHP